MFAVLNHIAISVFMQQSIVQPYSISAQNFVTDLAATSGRVKTISSEAERMVKAGHSQAREIQTRQQQLKRRYIETGSTGMYNAYHSTLLHMYIIMCSFKKHLVLTTYV